MNDIKRPNDSDAPALSVDGVKASSVAQSAKKKKRQRKPRLLSVLMFLVLVGLAVGSTYLYKKYRDTQAQVQQLSTVQGQQELSKTQTSQLLGEIRSIAIVPTDSGDPTVATIVDAKKLQDSADASVKEFYKNVENNDQIVAFQKDKKITIYIYRASTKQIVNIGAFQVDNTKK